jgi:predicted MPP superfamily phosphohydrolase
MWRIFMIFVLLAYTGINVYTGGKLFALVKYFLPSFKAFVFWPLYIFLCYSMVAVYILRLARVYPVREAAMHSFPLILYFFMLLLIFDGIKLVLHFLHRLPATAGFSAVGTGVALGLAVLLIIYGSFHARDIRNTNYNINLNKSGGDSSLRIALITDLHIGDTVGRKWVANIVDTVNRANPDIVCIAGDIFDSSPDQVPDLENTVMELKRLVAPLGVYACPGNHDRDSPSGGDVGNGTGSIRDLLKNADVVYLQDETVFVADRFYIIGRKDARPIGPGRQERQTAAELTVGLDTSLPLIFLDHQPVDFPAVQEAGADLILSGHTHQGQFFPGNLITARIFKRAGATHYGHWRGRSAQALVSSGAGVWGPPIRFATNSETAVVDITFDDTGG